MRILQPYWRSIGKFTREFSTKFKRLKCSKFKELSIKNSLRRLILTESKVQVLYRDEETAHAQNRGRLRNNV